MRLRSIPALSICLWLGAVVGWTSLARAADSAEAAQAEAGVAAIDGWIAELDDNRYLVRERATRRLLEAGAAALDRLLAAANGDRPEPADRALYILRRQASSSDNDLAIAALERIQQLRGRPLLVEQAEAELGERSLIACQQRLTALGAEVSVQVGQLDVATVAALMHIRLGDEWQGAAEDFRCLGELRQQLHFRLDGEAVDDEVVSVFEDKQDLEFLQLRWTKVTPDAVDAIKRRHPDALVHVRNAALMGVQAENHAAGVKVLAVNPPAAAAGIVADDVIAKVDGRPVPDFDRLTARIAQHQPGEQIDVEIIRGDERKQISVTLGSWEEHEGALR